MSVSILTKRKTHQALLALYGLFISFELLATTNWPVQIIEMNHRNAEDIAPLIRPFLAADETLVPHQTKLIVRASPESISTIQTLLKDLDVNATEFIITVVQGRDITQEELLGRAAARMTISGSQMNSQSYQLNSHRHITRSDSSDNNTQYLRTIEGKAAIIESGEDRAIPEYQQHYYNQGNAPAAGINYRTVTSGFAVTPRMSGNVVMLEIAPWSDSPSEIQGGNINVSGASTTLQVPTGEWVNLGGKTAQIKQSGQGSYSTYRNTRNDSWNIYVKVETVTSEQP